MIRKLAWISVTGRRLLCVRSRGREAFYVPGGKPEPGEDDVTALTREIAEELGIALVAETIRPHGIFEAPADGKPGSSVRIETFLATGLGVPVPQAEIEEIRLVGASDPLPVSAATRLILARLEADNVID
jgi:8-oxo-dGTP pyrophosphatase MutT (NUDIX family)